METSHHDFNAREPGFRFDIDRNSSTIIGNLYRAIGEKRHNNFGAVTGKRLIDRVINNLPEAVHESARIS